MTKKRGRPRSFDAETALKSALAVFWRLGFQGASLSELTEATGLNKPSLYAAFGDKEALYLRALDRYAEVGSAERAAILDAEADGRYAVEKFLRSMARMFTNPALPGGCFIVNSTADCGSPATPSAVELALHKALQGIEEQLRQRLKRAQDDGQIAETARVGDLAAFFSSLVTGLAVQAKGGAKRAKLQAAIDAAMAAWPLPATASSRPSHSIRQRERSGRTSRKAARKRAPER